MPVDAPEYHTKSTTPLSPVPVHPPEPSNITVLRNQIDPDFNMTSTHLDPAKADEPLVDAIIDPSFEDAYAEDDPDADKLSEPKEQEAEEPEDDYAMTFDSDAESSADSHIQSESSPAPVSDKPNTALNPTHESDTAPLSQSSLDNSPPPPKPTEDTVSIHDSAVGDANSTTHAPLEPKDDTSEIVENAAASKDSDPTSKPSQNHTYEEIASGDVDIQQLLDNITARAELTSPNEVASSPLSASQAFTAPPQSLPAHSSLPPRPQTVQNLPPLPSYTATGIPSMPPPPGMGSFGAPGAAPGAPGAPGTVTANYLPPPPSSMYPAPPGVAIPPMPFHFPAQPHAAPSNTRPEQTKKERSDGIDYGEVQWSQQVQKLYDEFLEDERGYVADGQWDKFPAGSRLFIGNLPSEKVTKRDIFYAFYKYGRLAQISIKQAYGFVQFLQPSSCYNALEREQGALLRGRKMHLEISKPQKNTRQANNGSTSANTNQRQRSPDNLRGNGRNGQQSRGANDGYDNRNQGGRRSGDYGVPNRGRDDYRPGRRSPSPLSRGGFRGRDDHQSRGGRDYYDGRRESRSKSPPYGRRDEGRYRNRSPSPRSRELDEDAELPIPRRNPRDIPDVFIILMDELDRNFVSWVEGELRARSLKTEVMFLNPRLPLAAVIRRQILEGVHAVTQLNRRSQDSSKIPLQVFDRKGGANNVRFDEYQDLEPKIAAELVLRAKKTDSAPPQTSYNTPQFGNNQSYQPPTPVPATTPALPNLANLVGNLDNATLQQLLGTLGSNGQQQQAQLHAATQQNAAIDLAGILGGLTKQAAAPQQQQQQQHYQQNPMPGNGYDAMAANNALSSLLGAASQPTQQNPPSQQQVQNIMAQLARFRQ